MGEGRAWGGKKRRGKELVTFLYEQCWDKRTTTNSFAAMRELFVPEDFPFCSFAFRLVATIFVLHLPFLSLHHLLRSAVHCRRSDVEDWILRIVALFVVVQGVMVTFIELVVREKKGSPGRGAAVCLRVMRDVR